MTKDEKVEILRAHTTEVCIKFLVSNDGPGDPFEELLALAEARPDYVTSMGGYAEDPERDELEHVADDVTDERLERLIESA